MRHAANGTTTVTNASSCTSPISARPVRAAACTGLAPANEASSDDNTGLFVLIGVFAATTAVGIAVATFFYYGYKVTSSKPASGGVAQKSVDVEVHQVSASGDRA